MKELLPILEATAQTGKPLVIIAEGRFNEGQGRITYLRIEVDDALEITEQTEI